MEKIKPFAFLISISAAISILCLISCAPTRDPFGLALRQGHTPVVAAPESLTVDLDIHINQKGAPPFSVRLYAQPYRRYRIDIFGFASQVVASYLWTDGHWKLSLNQRGQRWEGQGDSLSLDVEGVSLHLPDIHGVLGFLWGEPLPGFRNRDDSVLAWSGDTLRWSFHGARAEARFDPSNGTCIETQLETLQLRYGPVHRFGSRVIPEEVEVFVDGESRLTLKVKKVQDHPIWKKNPF